MSDTKPAFEQLTDTARLALARGDRETARVSLSMALHNADADRSIAAETPEALLRLGSLYVDAGLAAEGERLFSDAVAIAETTLGRDHLETSRALARLGAAMITRGAHDEAEPVLVRALTISEQRLAPESPDLNVLLNALSRLYLRRGAFERAAPLLDRLLALKRAKGDDHPEVATVLASLALVRQGVGDHEGAEQLGRRVLQIRERTLAPNHYGIASALELLADSCAARGKVGEAILCYQRALSIREQTLGVSHASLRVARERIADLQLQAAEESDFGDFASPMMSTPAAVPMVTPPVATRPVALPADVIAALPATLSIAPRREPERVTVAPRPAETVFADEEEPSETRQQALVLPAFEGALSLHEELGNIENELNEAAALDARRSRFTETAASLWLAISRRRAPVAIAGACVVALLLAVRIAQPRGAEEQGPRSSADRTQPTPRLASAAPAATDPGAAGTDSSLYRTSAGSLALRPVAATTASRSVTATREAERAQGSSTPRDADAPLPELGRTGRLALPNVVIQANDSIARLAQPRVGADSFSRQFWTNGFDRKADADAGSPKNAKLIGDMPQPYYPEFLRKNGVEGEVVAQFTVDQNGRPDVSTFEAVRSPHDALTSSVRKVVERMRFEPALSGGSKPLPRTEVVQISFFFKASVK